MVKKLSMPLSVKSYVDCHSQKGNQNLRIYVIEEEKFNCQLY